MSYYEDEIEELIFQNELEIKSYRKERIGIIVGLIIGVIIGIYVSSLYSKSSGSILVYKFLFPVWITFTCGSLVTIIKEIKAEFNELKDKSHDDYSGSANLITLLMLIIVKIIGSPIFTIARFIKTFVEVKYLKELNEELSDSL